MKGKELTTLLRKNVIGHPLRLMDKEDTCEGLVTLQRFMVAVDHEPGTSDADIGKIR